MPEENETMFKVGEVVRVRDDIADDDKRYYMRSGIKKDIASHIVNPDMESCKGMKATITDIGNNQSCYRLDILNGRWSWTDDMLMKFKMNIVENLI